MDTEVIYGESNHTFQREYDGRKEFHGLQLHHLPPVNKMHFSDKPRLHESRNCNSETSCRNCRPRLRRLKFEVNEMKCTNAFLKEHLQACGSQCKDADQTLSGKVEQQVPGMFLNVFLSCFMSWLRIESIQKSAGAQSSRRGPSLNSSPASLSNAPEKGSNLQILSPASKALMDLQKKLVDWTEQYGLLAQKYNEMMKRLQDCHDALYCSSKKTSELEKVNLELQLQLKEILVGQHCAHEAVCVKKHGVNGAFATHFMGAMLQKNAEVVNAPPVYGLDAPLSRSLHGGSAACARSVTGDFQWNTMPSFNSDSLSGLLLVSNSSVNSHGLVCIEATPVISIPCMNIEAPNGDSAASSGQPIDSDGTVSSHFGVSESESGSNSDDCMANEFVMGSSTPRKQQSSGGQLYPAISEVALPSAPDLLKSRNLKHTKANHTLSPASRHLVATSTAAGNQSHDKNGHATINIPKIISIRTNSKPVYANGKKNCGGAAADAAPPILSPGNVDKPGCNRHQSALIRTEGQTEMKVVALAKDMECVAFPQGTYKTEMCNKWVKNMGQFCPYGDKCQFAHGSHELRPVLRHSRYKSILCRMVAAGEVCPYEHRCHFRHVIYPHEAKFISFNVVSNSTRINSQSYNGH